MSDNTISAKRECAPPGTIGDRPRSPASSLCTWLRRLACFALSVLGLVLLAGCAAPLRTGSDQSSALSPAVASERQCIRRQGLPDARCTPGAVRSGVSLATICAYGYSRSVRPPESYTEPLKLAQMRVYGLPGAARDYEEDHLVPLSIGGAPKNPANLWPEPRQGPHNAQEKDQLETWAARMACSRRVPLAALQHDMATNWIALFRAADGEQILRSYPPGG